MSGEIRVNEAVNGEQRVWDETNAVVTLADGGFIVAYSGKGTGDNDGIFARRFAANGSPLSQEIAVNTYKPGKQSMPAIAANASGDFVIAWNGKGSDDTNGIFFQRFRADGARQGQSNLPIPQRLGSRLHPTLESHRMEVWLSSGRARGLVTTTEFSIADFKRTVLRMVASKG